MFTGTGVAAATPLDKPLLHPPPPCSILPPTPLPYHDTFNPLVLESVLLAAQLHSAVAHDPRLHLPILSFAV